MAWKLRNTRPCPSRYPEYSYGEVVDVINGECMVTRVETRDLLLKQGYELVEEKACDARESPSKGEEVVEEPHANNCPRDDDSRSETRDES